MLTWQVCVNECVCVIAQCARSGDGASAAPDEFEQSVSKEVIQSPCQHLLTLCVFYRRNRLRCGWRWWRACGFVVCALPNSISTRRRQCHSNDSNEV